MLKYVAAILMLLFGLHHTGYFIKLEVEEINMEADKILDEWGECINTHDLSRILSLYSKEAMLWGTFSTILRDNHELIKAYFVDLFTRDSLAVKFKSAKNRVFANTYIYSGSYDLSYVEQELIILPARYTFVIRKFDEEGFKIVEHHSSLVPSE